MNRKLMCAVLAAGAATFATGAMAADLPSSAPAPAPYIAPPPPVFTWTGVYVGVNAGVSFAGNNNVTFSPAGLPGSPSLNPSANSTAGFTGGGQIGYNWQINQFVVGVEGDLDYLQNHRLNGNFTSPAFFTAFPTFGVNGGNQNQLFGTIRGRLGWAVDRALFYVTGGVAFNGNSAPNSLTFNPPGGVGSGRSVFTATNNSNNDVGGVVGAGVEYAFTPNWTAKVEYLHTFFNNRNIVFANSAGQTFTTSGFNFDTNIVRVGLNYKF
jgi:outer membrane immunogenic protein